MNSTTKKYILIGFVITVSLVSAILISRGRHQNIKETTAQHKQKKAEKTEKIKGPEDAPITLVEFSDFQCPSCARSQEPLKKLVAQFPGLVQVHFRHFPLEMHHAAMDAAKSSECANSLGNFWDYQDLLFQDQQIWTRDPDPKTLFLAYANLFGFNQSQFRECLADPKILQEIQNDKHAGEALEVRSTPTFFINGERLVGFQQLTDSGPDVIRNRLSTMVAQKGKS